MNVMRMRLEDRRRRKVSEKSLENMIQIWKFILRKMVLVLILDL